MFSDINDIDRSGNVDGEDLEDLVVKVIGTWFGDANLDGEFNSGDLITVLAAGTYETNIVAGWASGDFDGSGRFDSADLIVALADGGYEAGPRAAVIAVPEPSTLTSVLVGVIAAAFVSRSRRRCD